MLRRLAILLAVPAIIGLISPAAAAQTAVSTAQTARVTYADLDLGTDEGAQILLTRIRSAARRVCAVEVSERDLSVWDAQRQCEREAVESAVAHSSATRLQSQYAAWRAGGAASPPRAFAQVETTPDATNVRTSYAGYDLNAEPGRRAIARRVNAAARRICNAGFFVSAAERRCMSEYAAQTQIQIAQAATQQLAAAPPTVAASALAASAAPDAAAGWGVCAPRTQQISFPNSGSAALTRAARLTLADAIDSASVCRLTTVVVHSGADGALGRRRAHALAHALVARGVPAASIRFDAGPAGFEMAFGGVATASGGTQQAAIS